MKVIIVGRNSDCDFIVNDVKVSRKHLQIIINDNGEYSVVDLGSMNGTFVNGNRIKGEVKLHRGDVIKIGNTELPWKDIVKRQDSDPLPKKPKKWIIYVFAALVIVLLSVIVGIVINDHRNSKEPKKNKEYTELELENKANNEYIDNLETLKKEAEKGKAKAEKAKDKAEEEKTAAKKAQGKAEEEKAAAKKAQGKAEEEKTAAKKAQGKAEEEKAAAEEAQGKAEKDKAAAETARDSAIQKLNDLQRQITLQHSYDSVKKESKEFYHSKNKSEQYKKYMTIIYMEVFKNLKSNPDESIDTLKQQIDKEFNKADLERKQKIIDIIKSVNKEAIYFEEHFEDLTKEERRKVYNRIRTRPSTGQDDISDKIEQFFYFNSINQKKVNNAIKAVLEANAVKK